MTGEAIQRTGEAIQRTGEAIQRTGEAKKRKEEQDKKRQNREKKGQEREKAEQDSGQGAKTKTEHGFRKSIYICIKGAEYHICLGTLYIRKTIKLIAMFMA
jgi:hypothetical protein